MRGHRSGFTIIELMVTLTVVGIALAIGAPSFSQFLKNGKLTSGVNDLVSAMHLTRSEASKRGTPVVICKSTNANYAESPTCVTTGGWDSGWLVYVDQDGDGAFSGEPTDTIVLRKGPQADTLIVKTTGEIDSTITYLPNGFAQLPPISVGGRYIVYCDESQDDKFSRILNMSNSGRPKVVSRDMAASAPSCSS